MKKVGLFILLSISTAILIGCGVEFEEVTIDGFLIDVEVEQILDQGEYELDEEGLAELLPDLAVEVETLDLVFNLELVGADFKHDLSEDEKADELVMIMPEINEIIIDTKGQVLFSEITFSHAGLFTYRITQNVELIEESDDFHWIIDDSGIDVVVTVIEDEEDEVLRASVEFLRASRFTNQFVVDIEEEVSAALIARLGEMQDELEGILQSIVDETSGQVGISYYCLTTGRHIASNGDARFNSASTRKLPTHMIIAQYVQDGHLSWDQQLTFMPGHFVGGSGNLQYSAGQGDTFAVKELLEYSIVYSDNIAHNILLSTITPSEKERFEYAVFEQDLPGEPIVGGWVMSANWLTEIFKVLYRDKDEIEEYGVVLEYMRNTSWTDRFATELADGYVAHTPGWSFEYSHDSGIFFTEFPYILVIMTANVPAAMTWDPDPAVPNFISEVSDMVFEMHYELQ